MGETKEELKQVIGGTGEDSYKYSFRIGDYVYIKFSPN